ncbi:hypothetical protein PSTT_07435 [Puccinia striiformis]|uniref:Uncharacterized protein n=1 Tax=Puccinia striiformis TaxID=27350 RepID=A0A2S4VGG8_9BASI|nr:hypothetical protein PSTT_07435 [Puccinia striiformis]
MKKWSKFVNYFMPSPQTKSLPGSSLCTS